MACSGDAVTMISIAESIEVSDTPDLNLPVIPLLIAAGESVLVTEAVTGIFPVPYLLSPNSLRPQG